MQDVFGIFYFTLDAFECALDSFNPTRSVEKKQLWETTQTIYRTTNNKLKYLKKWRT